jgi:hypothetical protein
MGNARHLNRAPAVEGLIDIRVVLPEGTAPELLADIPLPEFLGNPSRTVYRTIGLDDNEIRILQAQFVKRDGRNCHGWAVVSANDVIANGLSILPTVRPSIRHADLTAWPSEVSARMAVATQLAALSTLHLL